MRRWVAPPTAKEAADAWERSAVDWIALVREQKSAWREHVILPAFWRLVGDVSGKRLVDLGCGEGAVTRELTRAGAHCTGVDLTPTLISAAREEAARQGLDITYRLGDMTDPSPFEPGSFDLVVSVMALTEPPNGLDTFAAASRLLKPGGEMVFIIPHPVLERGEWEADDEGLRTACVIRDYYGPAVVLEKVARWFRDEAYQFCFNLSDYLNALAEAGLMILASEEPVPDAAGLEEHPKLRWFLKISPLWAVRARKVP